MSLRETLARSPKIALVIVGSLLVVAAAMALSNFKQPNGPRPVSEAKVFFSTDDGKTWFPDSITKPSPFEKDGKLAYRVYVWKTDDGSTWVSHLQRGGTSSAGSASDEARNSAVSGTSATRQPAKQVTQQSHGIEVKRPGDTTWVSANSTEGEEIAAPKCPKGNNAGLEQVEP